MYDYYKLYTRFFMIKTLDKKREKIDKELDNFFNMVLSEDIDYTTLDSIADSIVLDIIRVKHSIYDYKKKTIKK